MLGNRGYTVSDLAPLAVIFVILTVVVGMGGLILSETQVATYDDMTTTNETFNATSDPYTLPVSHASDTDFVELTSVTVYPNDTTTSALSDTAYNITDASAGDVKVSTSVDSNNEAIDYDYHTSNDATSVIQDGLSAVKDFSSWFSILVVVVIAAVILGIVMRYFSGMGQTSRRV